VLDEQRVTLGMVMDLKVGDTLFLDASPTSEVELRCGNVPLTRGRMGRLGHSVALRLSGPLSPVAKKAMMRFA
jgi:flagellar motor switch protein FliM